MTRNNACGVFFSMLSGVCVSLATGQAVWGLAAFFGLVAISIYVEDPDAS